MPGPGFVRKYGEDYSQTYYTSGRGCANHRNRPGTNSGFGAEDNSMGFIHLSGLIPLTLATEHSVTSLNVLLVCLFFFFKQGLHKHFSCCVIFSLVLFYPDHKPIHLLCLILRILHMNIFGGKKNMNLPDVTGFPVVLVEFWFSALEGRKENY